MSNQFQLLVVVTTSSHPYSITSERLPFISRQAAENAKTKIERELNGYNTGMSATVVLMEGASD